MLLKEMGKKGAIVAIAFGLIASPLAMANSSIELNKDRSAGQNVIDKPTSHTTSNADNASAHQLNRDESDSLDFSPSSSSSDIGERKHRSDNIRPEDLTRDEGDSTDW
ncbi:hypothetical protein J7J47_17675 [Halomonas sp. ISL-60]|uniref:hypothetical protein n=1 Tax=unclassified Halomonas TaxID=2609666 RepID=UPI0007DA34D7|nr:MULTISPECIES: hypothetical protein [unclassified Halomonas]MBT2774056.1 hypothetical protein [Halomonas sp. ISL-60]MBT2787565.1 hypothetical protein [Halomonas sp. ISL-106]MBT2799052.1 hypothetical protein [Halomonas sp. ISL-104]MBT2803662.1 hypothetical protein [Halomonas sp. ISL-56]OAL61515.1 hypothetical protein A6R74_13460 [Halomonas sp. ALS9]